MAVTINGVLCQELVSGYNETVVTNKGLGSRKGYLCPWTNRFQVAKGLLGLSHATSIGGLVTLYTPMPHPEFNGAFVTSIQIEGAGHPKQGPVNVQFDYAKVWANFEQVPWFGNDPFNQIDPVHPFIFAEQRLTAGVEWLQVPGKGCYWSGASTTTVQDHVPLRLALVEMEITIKQLPYMPSAQAFVYAGTCNSSTYLGVAPGYLLYNGVTTVENALSDGTKVQEATFKFTYRSVRWDNMFDPARGVFDKVYIGPVSNNLPIVPSVDLSQVIPPYYQVGTFPSGWSGG